MPNISHCQLSINLPEVEFYEDGVGSQAMRQNRWDLMKKLRDELDELGCDLPDLLDVLRPEPEDSDFWWRSNNWGTKWSEIHHYEYEPDLHLVQFTLETAWGPPLEICQYLTDEFGFEVRCVWSSYENSDWGVWEYGDIAIDGEVEMWHEDNFDELRELLDGCADYDSRLEQMMTMSIFGSFETTRYISDHDREWVEEEWRDIFVSQLEEYETWLEDQPDSDRVPLIKMKQELLEDAESRLENGQWTEGEYLIHCNKLKNITREQLELVIKQHQPAMINYYRPSTCFSKPYEEPKLIEFYNH